MKDEKETRKKLLASAKQEFQEKGFMQASLRTICKNAGVTTGALYFFFKDKNELFVSLVEEPLQHVEKEIKEHFLEEGREKTEQVLTEAYVEADMRMATHLAQEMYAHREALLLLLTKAQGSSMESVLDRIVAMVEQHYTVLAKVMMKKNPKHQVSGYMLHRVAHMQVEAFVYMLTHIEDEKEACEYIQQEVRYMLGGWCGMFGIVPNVTV